jgi:hypothetical protein
MGNSIDLDGSEKASLDFLKGLHSSFLTTLIDSLEQHLDINKVRGEALFYFTLSTLTVIYFGRSSREDKNQLINKVQIEILEFVKNEIMQNEPLSSLFDNFEKRRIFYLDHILDAITDSDGRDAADYQISKHLWNDMHLNMDNDPPFSYYEDSVETIKRSLALVSYAISEAKI